MLNKLFEVLYHKVFINIVVEKAQTVVYVEVCNKNGVVSSDAESFDTLEIDTKMYEYIDSFILESPLYYISILDTSDDQGAIPTCIVKDMVTFCDLESSKFVCHKNGWSYYTSRSDLDSLQQHYSEIGIDFVFSPFVILANFFKDKIENPLTLYILIEDKNITIGVFDNQELLYGDHRSIEKDDSEELLIDENDVDEIELDLEDSIDLDDIDAMNDIEGLDDFGDIEDLDSVDEIDEFAESENEELESNETEKISQMDEAEGFNDDYQRFSLIQSSVNTFYKDSRYKSKFIESVYIADAIGISGDLKRYLEEEMFLNVFVRQLDLAAEVCEIAKAELK